MTQAEGPMLTVPEIAARLGVSESTVRNWLRACRDLIGSETGVEGYRRWDLRPFERIAAMRERRLPMSAIRATLAGERAEPAEPSEPFEQAILTRLDRIADALDRIADYFDANDPPTER